MYLGSVTALRLKLSGLMWMGAGSRSIFGSDSGRKNSGGPPDLPRPAKQLPDAAKKPSRGAGIAALAVSLQASAKVAGKAP